MVMISCAVDNLGSNKNIKALGGVIERNEIDPNDNIESSVYWINVDESLENDKEVYEGYVSEK